MDFFSSLFQPLYPVADCIARREHENGGTDVFFVKAPQYLPAVKPGKHHPPRIHIPWYFHYATIFIYAIYSLSDGAMLFPQHGLELSPCCLRIFSGLISKMILKRKREGMWQTRRKGKNRPEAGSIAPEAILRWVPGRSEDYPKAGPRPF